MKDFVDKNRAWVVFGGLFLIFYVYQIAHTAIYPPAKPLLFDNPELTLETMEKTGVGHFYRYICGNDGRCQSYIGSRPMPEKDHSGTSMSIEGIKNKVQSITITCYMLSTTKNKYGSRLHFYHIESKAIEYLGGTQAVADSLYQHSVPNIDFGQYSASSRVENDTYEITITRKI